MKTIIKKIDFKYFPIIKIFLFIPFHLIEEAYMNFPLWMFEHYNLPKQLSYPHWLINNSIFLTVLIIGLKVFIKNKTKYLFFGFGILIWGFMNSMEHIIFSVLDSKLSPGFYTAILFLTVFIIGLIKLYQIQLINYKLVIKSFLIALSYWIIPILIIMILGSFLVEIFP